MYLGYKYFIQKNNLLQATILGTALIFTVVSVTAQNVSSPYSILGIGDVDTKDFGRYFGSGNAAIARRDVSSYNFSNPASLTALPFKTMNFDIAMRGRSSNFASPGIDTLTDITKDFVVKRVTIAFKADNKSAFAFGLKPYSSVNYQYNTDKVILDGASTYTKYISGSGGLNQVYGSYGRTLGKYFSAGVTGSFLFGASAKETYYYGSSINLAVQKNEITSYSGATLQGGIQYQSIPKKKWQHTIGATITSGTSLRGEYSVEYLENDESIKKTVEISDKFRLPVTGGLGYTATLNNKLSFSLEGNYYNWKYQKVNYSRSYTNPSSRLSMGVEYSKKIKYLGRPTQSNPKGEAEIEKWYFGGGISMENAYIKIKEKNLWDYSASIGGGYNLINGISIYSGLEIGQKGNLNVGQFKENYTQFIIGLTIKDIWIGPKHTRKYD